MMWERKLTTGRCDEGNTDNSSEVSEEHNERRHEETTEKKNEKIRLLVKEP